MSDRPYVLALDQGTTSSRCILFDRQQNIVGLAQREFGQHYPKPGWVEHDPMEIYSSQYSVLTEVLAQSGVDPAQVAAIGITNQRETTIVWERVAPTSSRKMLCPQFLDTPAIQALPPQAEMVKKNA